MRFKIHFCFILGIRPLIFLYWNFWKERAVNRD